MRKFITFFSHVNNNGIIDAVYISNNAKMVAAQIMSKDGVIEYF